MKLENKVAVVTGASSGIGRDTATLFASEGATVIACARRLERLEQLAEEAKDCAGNIVAYRLDVGIPDEIEKMYDFVMEKYGKLDIVINNAGILDGLAPLHECSLELWNKLMGVNATSVFVSCKRAVTIMMEQGGGSIVNVSSVAGIRGLRGGSVYTASKHAVSGLTKSIAGLYWENNIRCNAILPSNIESEVMENSEELNMTGIGVVSKMAGGTLPGTGMDCAKAILYLASDDGAYVSGALLPVDLGVTCW